MFKTIWRSGLIAFVSAFLLVSCGGGGGGDGGSQDVSPNVAISDSNGPTIVAQALDADDLASESSSFLTFSAGTSSNRDLFDVADQMLALTGIGETGPSIQNHELVCDGGGSVDDSSAGSSSGTITFYDCTISGVTFNGTLSYGGGSTANSYQFTFGNLSISDGTGFSASLDGDMTTTVNTINTTTSTTISGSRFTIGANGEYVRLLEYELAEEYDSSTATFTVYFSYTLDSSLIGGRVRVSTDPSDGGAPLVRSGTIYPYTGSVVVFGEGGTRVRATAQGSGLPDGMVLIEYDNDGDGTYESNETMTWSELDLLDEV